MTKQEELRLKAARKRVELWSKTKNPRFVMPEAKKIITVKNPGRR